ncbi:DUF1801 domain-containing protein [Mucilaginibacter sp. UYCu711]|uniref:DUF1801 domain-containing protein n=1 Tax=Mucilaginibacter sp. UYCu711 TaxID=3156339 RepID=UPI003D1D3D1D
MAKDINDPQSVTSFINKLDPPFAQLVETIRQLILSTSPDIAEQIKWNSPSFFYSGDMKPFAPKEYKRDIIVLNTRKNVALLIFPTGAIINDTTGILEGNYTDGRRMVTFKTMDEVKTKADDLQKVIRQWLALVDK